jgi:hypothetical protein
MHKKKKKEDVEEEQQKKKFNLNLISSARQDFK